MIKHPQIVGELICGNNDGDAEQAKSKNMVLTCPDSETNCLFALVDVNTDAKNSIPPN